MAKEKRLLTGPNRWGSGRVHRYLYDRVNKLWYCACQKPYAFGYHGAVVDSDTPVTCKRCLRSQP